MEDHLHTTMLREIQPIRSTQGDVTDFTAQTYEHVKLHTHTELYKVPKTQTWVKVQLVYQKVTQVEVEVFLNHHIQVEVLKGFIFFVPKY